MHYDPCARCQAANVLTGDDWYLIGFYRLVADQITGEAATPRLEGYESALRLHGYPESHHPWLVGGAVTLHRLMTKTDEPNWLRETGKRYRDIRPEDVADGD